MVLGLTFVIKTESKIATPLQITIVPIIKKKKNETSKLKNTHTQKLKKEKTCN